MAVDSVSSAADAANMATSRKTIADNFDTFLSLLTTQLKNQNPLDPLDTNQFTQQMVQFTGVEQQLKTNEFLQALVLGNQSSSYTDAVNFIGKEVTSSGSSAQLINGKATWHYSVGQNVSSATVTITDPDGNVIQTANTPLSAGEGQFQWDGTDSTGQSVPDGRYTITIDARDGNGKYIPVSTKMSGVVSSVDLSGDEPVLIVDGQRIDLSSITSVGTKS